MKKYMVLALGLCALNACSPREIDLSYTCEPSGATVYEEGMGQVGTCPMTLKYNSLDSAVEDNVIYTKKIRVVWASGASLLVPATAVPIVDESKASLSFIRPPDFPYPEKDLNASVAFENSLAPPDEKYVMSPHQDSDGFAALDHDATCAWDWLTLAVYAHCP